MKFEDLPKEIRSFTDKISETELLRFWTKPKIHLGGFSPCEMWETGNQERKQEVLLLLKHRLR